MTDAELQELVRAVLSRPDDHDVLRVYADVLIERSDPRGELIVVQLARIAADTPALAAREEELATQLGDEVRRVLAQPRARLHWHLGFVDTIEFLPAQARSPLAPAIKELGTLPVARRLRRIVIRCIEPGWGPLVPAIAQLARIAPQLKNLREIAVTARGGPTLLSPPTGDLGKLTRACPKLEVLELGTNDYALRGVELPSLRRLVLETVTWSDLMWVEMLPLPKLEQLVIDFGDSNMEGNQYLERMLRRELPRLRELRLSTTNAECMTFLAKEVPASPLARHLRVLGLHGAPFGDKAIRRLAKHSEWLRKLERVEVVRDHDANTKRLDATLGGVLAFV